MAMIYLKALHIIFIVTWFAGLFSLVRLFIYHTEAFEQQIPEREAFYRQYALMQWRMWYIITWPSAILTAILGLGQIHQFMPLTPHPWLIVKLVLVALLYAYHFSCGHILKKLKAQDFCYSSQKLRIWNEAPALLLVSIVFLAVLKNTLNMLWGLGGFLGLMIVLAMGIKIYRKIRLRSN